MAKKERPFDPNKPVRFREVTTLAPKGTKVRIICKDAQRNDGSEALCIGIKTPKTNEYFVLRGKDGKHLSRTGTKFEGPSDLVNVPQSQFLTVYQYRITSEVYQDLSTAAERGKNRAEQKPLGVLEQDEDENFIAFHPWEKLNE